MRFDLHVHTTISSCSKLSITDILEEAKTRNLAGVCLTDHDTMAARHEIKEGLQSDGLCVICGMEYTTAEGDFLLFGPFADIPSGLPATDLLKLVRKMDGVAVAAHPFREHRPTQEHLIAKGLCRFIEGVNGRNHEHENQQAMLWEKLYGVRQVGGSDAHSLRELGQITTRFHHPVKNRADLIQALKSGAFNVAHNDGSIGSLNNFASFAKLSDHNG